MIRLDHFLPFFRKRKRDEPAAAPVRTPWAPLLSDRETGRKGWIRRALLSLGASWHSAPVRRTVQSAFFAGFVVLFAWVCWPYGGTDYAAHRESKEKVAAEFFLIIDPLVALSTAIASRSWVWSLGAAGLVLAACLLIPRGFCGYVCPLGTVIDLFDWAVGSRFKKWRLSDERAERGWWAHLKYYLLLGCLAAGLFGVLLTGFVAAIPVVTRAFLFLLKPLELGFAKGWYLNTGFNAGHVVSVLLFLGILALGLLRRRFWCQYVCPSGALFSLGNLFRATERKVESSCISCNKCVEICPFDAIKPDYTTRELDCTFCQSCGGVCPTHSIKFTDRWESVSLKLPETGPERRPSRRGFLAGALAGAGAAAAIPVAWGAAGRPLPVRPPGSLPEPQFLQACIRCGECFQACPNDVLQPMGFEQGLEGLWTPRVAANWAGCEAGCNNCGQVCPTGAIRALPMEEKRVARMGLALVQPGCLPLAGREECRLCVDECNAAGYRAIEFMRVRPELDEKGAPVEGSGFSAPSVIADRCVGCGLCQTRCHVINVKERGVLESVAIVVEAGPGREDRIERGSYLALREQERRARTASPSAPAAADSYLPDFLK